MRPGAFWRWFLLACVLVAPQLAWAEAPATGTILLLVDARASALATRVAAELEALGFSVQTREQEPRQDELAPEARRAGAFAVIGIGPTAEGNVEITVLDRVTGKTVRREVLGRSLTDPTTRELVALRASELLRASLMEIEAPHPPRGEVPAPPAVVRVARAPETIRRPPETIRRPERHLRLGVESGVFLPPGFSLTPLLQAVFGVRALERLELGVTLGTQLTASRRDFEAGRVEATARWLSAGPKLLLFPRTDSSQVVLGMDTQLAVMALSASGFATDSEHRGQSRFAWAVAATVGIDSKIRLHKQLWWTLKPSVGFAANPPVLRSGDEDSKLWGRPWLQCSSGLEVEL